MQLIARAYPYVAKRLLTDEAIELRCSLQEFLLKDGSFRFICVNQTESFRREQNGFPDATVDDTE